MRPASHDLSLGLRDNLVIRGHQNCRTIRAVIAIPFAAYALPGSAWWPFLHFPLFAKQANFLAIRVFFFLHILVETRHLIFMLMLLNPLVQRRKPGTQI